MTGRADHLLDGPRGRRLCLALALGGAGHWPPSRWQASPSGSLRDDVHPRDLRRSLRALVRDCDVAALARARDPLDLLPALVESVDWARYWQEADDADQLLTDPALAAELAQLADAVVSAPAAAWWATPLAGDDQHAVAWPEGDPPRFHVPRTTGAALALHRWREETLADERRSAQERPADPRAPWSGSWWSVPVSSGLTVTCRSVPEAPTSRSGIRTPLAVPAGLVLVEDELGWPSARTWPVRPSPDARVYEVTGPDSWVALVERHPLEVTASRRHDWWRVTGWDGAWAVPDWAAVAAEHDAIHLTVDGYLSTAGRALPVALPGARPVRTLLAGWDPDATWWLTDGHIELGHPTDWRRRDDQPPRWEPAG